MMTIDGYTVDAEIAGEPTYENEATEYPVEEGIDLVDHVRQRPVTFACEGIVSDTPIGDMREAREALGVLGGEGPSRDAHARFVELYERREPVTVTCALGTFDGMVLTTYAPKRVGGSLQFSATFKYIRIITNQRTTVRVAVPRARAKDTVRATPTTYVDARGRVIETVKVPLGSNRGTSMYRYADDGMPVPEAEINKVVRDTGAVRVKYVNGVAVPFDEPAQQPAGVPERRWWVADDVAPSVEPPLTVDYSKGIPYE